MAVTLDRPSRGNLWKRRRNEACVILQTVIRCPCVYVARLQPCAPATLIYFLRLALAAWCSLSVVYVLVGYRNRCVNGDSKFKNYFPSQILKIKTNHDDKYHENNRAILS